MPQQIPTFLLSLLVVPAAHCWANVGLLVLLVCAFLWLLRDGIHRHSGPDGVVMATNDA